MIKFCTLAASAALMITAIPTLAQSQVYTYECDSGKTFRVQYGTNAATLQLNNQSISLPAVSAASGQSRYSNGSYTLFTTASNTEAFLELNGDRTHEGCIAQPQARSTSTPSSPQASPAPVRGLW